MGTDYEGYPALDRTRLRDGYKMCIGNAGRLMNDANLLKEAGRFRSAYLIVHLAVEELGCATQLYEAGRSGVQDWKEWWSRYLDHPEGTSSLDGATAEQPTPESGRAHQRLMYVDFGRSEEAFSSPLADEDSELLRLFEEKAAAAVGILKALPTYAFERLEFKEMVEQSPEMTGPILYARIEEILSGEPGIDEKDLLAVIADDMGLSPVEVAAGFEQWKRVSPKARAYLDLLQRVQDRLRKEREGKDDPSTAA
jgi:AbiV